MLKRRACFVAWSLFLVLALSASGMAQEKLFKGKLVLPKLNGFEHFEGLPKRANRPKQEWSLEAPGKHPLQPQLFYHPESGIAIRVWFRTVPKDVKLKNGFDAKEFQKHFAKTFKGYQPKGSTEAGNIGQVGGNPGYINAFFVASALENNSRKWLIVLSPKKAKPMTAYFIAISTPADKKNMATAEKLVTRILKEAKLP